MAAKEKISINKFETLLTENIITVPLNGAEDINMRIKINLSLVEMLQFVEDVVSSCIDKDTGSYSPEIKDFSIRAGILTEYANFRLPQNIEKQYELVYNTDAVAQVMQYINRDQYVEICKAIDSRIEYERNIITSIVSLKVNELVARIEVFTEKFEGLLDGISGDDIGGAFKGLATMKKVDENLLAKAVMDAYRPEANNLNAEGEGKIVSLPKNEM